MCTGASISPYLAFSTGSAYKGHYGLYLQAMDIYEYEDRGVLNILSGEVEYNPTIVPVQCLGPSWDELTIPQVLVFVCTCEIDVIDVRVSI